MKITKNQLKQIIKEELQAAYPIKEEYANRKAGTYEQHMMVPKDHPKYSAEHQEMWDNLGKALAMIENSKAGIEALGLGNAGNPSEGGPFEPYTFYSKSQIEALEKIIILFEYGEII